MECARNKSVQLRVSLHCERVPCSAVSRGPDLRRELTASLRQTKRNRWPLRLRSLAPFTETNGNARHRENDNGRRRREKMAGCFAAPTAAKRETARLETVKAVYMRGPAEFADSRRTAS